MAQKKKGFYSYSLKTSQAKTFPHHDFQSMSQEQKDPSSQERPAGVLWVAPRCSQPIGASGRKVISEITKNLHGGGIQLTLALEPESAGREITAGKRDHKRSDYQAIIHGGKQGTNKQRNRAQAPNHRQWLANHR